MLADILSFALVVLLSMLDSEIVVEFSIATEVWSALVDEVEILALLLPSNLAVVVESSMLASLVLLVLGMGGLLDETILDVVLYCIDVDPSKLVSALLLSVEVIGFMELPPSTETGREIGPFVVD